jgi:hypothetical protein
VASTPTKIIYKEHQSTSLVQADGGLAYVEEDKVFRLMSHKSSEIAPDNAMPRRAILLIKKSLNEVSKATKS